MQGEERRGEERREIERRKQQSETNKTAAYAGQKEAPEEAVGLAARAAI